MFHILDPANANDFNYLSQMHHLRHKVFYQNLKWQAGLQIFSQMEFDQYDHNDARYLVRVNEKDSVDACARLTRCDKPYLLGYSFSDYISDCDIPNTTEVFEISRLCADHTTAPQKITGQLMAAMLEFGIINNIKQYISLSDVKIIPIVRRFGWQANKLGPLKDTGTDISVALSYDVTKEFHENVKRIVGVETLIQDQVKLQL